MVTAKDRDYDTLLHDPQRLVVEYQGMIRAITCKYIETGMFGPEHLSDVIQAINAELLARIPRIQALFNGSTLVRTYVSAVIRNICLKLRKDGEYGTSTPTSEGEIVRGSSRVIDRYSIERARQVFRAILLQYDRHLPKLLVCLKLLFRLPLTKGDILAMYPQCPPRELRRIRARFGRNYAKVSDKEIFALLTPFFNMAEGKENSEDALRKWANTKVNEILDLLDDSFPGGCFDKESLNTLLEDFISPFLLKD
jgi:hypothetical protein